MTVGLIYHLDCHIQVEDTKGYYKFVRIHKMKKVSGIEVYHKIEEQQEVFHKVVPGKILALVGVGMNSHY